MIDYDSMTDLELDGLTATLLMEHVWLEHDNNWCHLNSGGILNPLNEEYGFDTDTWSPTHKKSNQADIYLFPIMMALGVRFQVKYFYTNPEIEDDTFQCFITCELQPLLSSTAFIKWTGSIEAVNRVKVICCLMAWDKLQEQSSLVTNQL